MSKGCGALGAGEGEAADLARSGDGGGGAEDFREKGFSAALRSLIGAMLLPLPQARPSAASILSQVVVQPALQRYLDALTRMLAEPQPEMSARGSTGRTWPREGPGRQHQPAPHQQQLRRRPPSLEALPVHAAPEPEEPTDCVAAAGNAALDSVAAAAAAAAAATAAAAAAAAAAAHGSVDVDDGGLC